MSRLDATLAAAGVLTLVASGVACEKARVKNEAPHNLVTILQVGGEQDGKERGFITETEYRYELARVRFERQSSVHAAALPQSLKGEILERLIERRILALEAQALGVQASTTAVAKELEQIRTGLSDYQLQKRLVDSYQTEDDLRRRLEERLTVGRLLREQSHSGVTISDDEVAAAWAQLPEAEKTRPPRVRASQIVVRTEEEGKKVLGLLKAGRPFEELARIHSIGPEGAHGGDLGWFEPGVMPKVFDEVCFSLKPDTLSPLTPSEYGFHVFKVTANEAAGPLGFDEVKDRLRSKLLLHKLEGAEAAYVERVRAKYRVVKDEHLLATIE